MVIMQKFASWFTPHAEERQAAELYIALVAQSRKVFFYERLGVPDTLDGRFEMLVLHMFLVFTRLHTDNSSESKAFWRLLTEALFADMDRNLREMGVSDTGMSRRMKEVAGGFYGRMDAYSKALQHREHMQETLRRNVYGTLATPPESAVEALADYVAACVSDLANQPREYLLSGNCSFAAPK